MFRTAIAYEQAGDALLRRAVRTEQATGHGKIDGFGDRVVSEIQFSNLQLQKKGGSR
jgi:hypothetical protein